MLVRCYFRAKGESNYAFVEMPLIVGNEYTGIIPAPSAGSGAIEYLLLAVNQNGVVVRSQVFETKRDTKRAKPAWQDVDMEGSITVKSELARVPQMIPGFADNIKGNAVESAFRFGYVVEGIYQLSQMVGAAPAGVVSGGTISATTTKPSGKSTNPLRTVTEPRVSTKTSEQQGRKKKGGISPVIIIGGLAIAAGGVLLATGVLGAKKVSVTITVWDSGTPTDDDFDVYLDNEKLGSTVGSTGSWTKELKENSTHTVKITLVSNSDSYMSVTISNTNKAAEDQQFMTLGSSYTTSFTVNKAT